VIPTFAAALVEQGWLFYLLALVTVAGALSVLLARNPITAAMCLVGTFFGLAAIYVLLSAHLIAALQLIVYAGAIMVLFVFVIMLLNLTQPSPRVGKVKAWHVIGGLAAAAGAFLLFLVFAGAPAEAAVPPEGFGSVAGVGRLLFEQYVLPFEATSILLLVAIVGAVVVAKGKI
jgi:NADH-quinone oxidoreductase subunit J